LRADLSMMRQGCQNCWSFHFLTIMTHLNIIGLQSWHPAHSTYTVGVDTILQLACHFKLQSVQFALTRLLCVRWNGLHPDPRHHAVPSLAFQRCVHLAWVLPMPATGSMHSVQPPHLKLCLPFYTLQCLARLRLGWHHLEVRVAKYRGVQDRQQRVCPLCSLPAAPFRPSSNAQHTPCVEHVAHFLLDCPAYTHIRDAFADVFPVLPARTDDVCASLNSLFAHHDQRRLALCVHAMTDFRKCCVDLVADGHDIMAALNAHKVAMQRMAVGHSSSGSLADMLAILAQLPQTLMEA
jgi:hypothetical protein